MIKYTYLTINVIYLIMVCFVFVYNINIIFNNTFNDVLLFLILDLGML